MPEYRVTVKTTAVYIVQADDNEDALDSGFSLLMRGENPNHIIECDVVDAEEL